MEMSWCRDELPSAPARRRARFSTSSRTRATSPENRAEAAMASTCDRAIGEAGAGSEDKEVDIKLRCGRYPRIVPCQKVGHRQRFPNRNGARSIPFRCEALQTLAPVLLKGLRRRKRNWSVYERVQARKTCPPV